MSILEAASASDLALGPHAVAIRAASLTALTAHVSTSRPPAPPPSLPPPAPVPSGTSEASKDLAKQAKAIVLFRASLSRAWPEYESSMLGGEHALSQVPRPSDREELVLGKLRSCVGPAGGNADRDRRALERLLAFCDEQHITRVWPVSAALLMNFCRTMHARSTGPRGGHSVPETLKAAFVHMKICIGLPVELDSPILFNICPHCSKSALSPASTSIYLQCFWEHHALHDPTSRSTSGAAACGPASRSTPMCVAWAMQAGRVCVSTWA